MEARHQSLDPQFVCGRSSLPHGDHPVRTAVSSSGRLDGLHRPQGSLPAGPCPSGLSSLPSVCSSGQCLPVLCPLLRAIHSSSGLHSGHGSCFRHSPLLGYPHEAVPRRLASPVLVSKLSPSRSPGSSGSLLKTGDCSQSCEVSPCSISGGTVPRSRDRLQVFPGFSVFGARRQASVNRRRISILRRSARQYLALASRHAVLSLPSSARCPSEGEVSSALSPQAVGSGRSVCPDSLVSGLPQGSSVVTRPSSSVSRGVSRTDLDFWSDASDVGWGAHLGSLTASGLWDQNQAALSINARELLVVQEGLLHFLPSLVGKAVSIFCNNSTVVSYLRKEGGTRSPFLNSLTQGILHWAESYSIRLLPQFIPGSLNVLADSISRPHQLPHTEWSLHPEVFHSISRLWPVQIDLFATSASRQCSVFFSPFRDPMAAGTDAFLQCWDRASSLRLPSVVCSSPSVGEAPRVSGDGAHSDRPLLASAPLISRPPSPVAGPSGGSASPPRPPASASVSLPLPGSPKASASCLETLRHFTRAAGFSSAVAAQASLSRRPSSHKAYQLKWQVYRQWCHSHGHSSSSPSLAKVTDFLCWLRSSKHLGVSSIKGYRSMLSAVFRFSYLLSLLILCFAISFALLLWSPQPASFVLLRGISPWF